MREALSIDVDGLRLQGTRHSGGGSRRRGVLFLNFGYQPRSARGDLAVHLADELARSGFTCFRFDLPGLGDSEGEVPTEVLEFYEFVQEGRYTDCVTKLARAVLAVDGLQDLALLGLCGGAITSIFAAPHLDPASICGLVLLDPQFFLYEGAEAAKCRSENGGSWVSKLQRTARKRYDALHDWLLETRWEPYLSAAYGRCKRVAGWLTSRRLPANANLPLLAAITKLLNQHMPVLAITAHAPSPLPPGFDYLKYIQKHSRHALCHVKIHDTTHSFVENGGRAAVLGAVTQWLSEIQQPDRNSRPSSDPQSEHPLGTGSMVRASAG